MQKLISLILPVFNEQQNIPHVYRALTELFAQFSTRYAYEIIFVNDGSTDDSWQILKKLAVHDVHVTALNLSRNFGHQIALTAGYDIARGDAIISMDGDMQDNPELILAMLNAWEQGNNIVYARRIDRTDRFLKRISAQVYYLLLDHISDVKIPRNVGDFRLIDKKVLQELQRCREKSRYLRGMVAWLGFKHTFVDFKRPDRLHGVTGYTWKKMFKLAFDGVTGFSLFPLKIAAFVGVFVIITGALMFGYISLDAVLKGVHYPLFKWLVTIIYIFMGVQFLLLWLIGEYIGRIFQQQKERPLYVVDKIIRKT